MEEKKQYIAPELKVAEFEVELGYAASTGLRQRTLSLGSFSGRPQLTYGEYGNGSYSGNNDDWD